MDLQPSENSKPLSIEPFEIEQPEEDPEASQAREVARRVTWRTSLTGRIFPLEIFCCCPDPIVSWIPVQLHKLQGWTHMLLVAGVFASTGLTIDGSLWLYRNLSGNGKDRPFEDTILIAVHNVVNLIFTVPCLFYFIQTVQQFDEDLQKKKLAAEAERQKLITTFNQTLGDMDAILTNATEINTGFAERAFETKRRDFLRFLDRSQARFASAVKDVHMQQVEQAFFVQMKQFCFLWFRVFAECSIDPTGDPKVVVSQDELDRCATLDELCEVCKERLRAREVKFITKQAETDAEEINKTRKKFKCLSNIGNLIVASQNAGKDKKGRHYTIVGDMASKSIHYAKGISWVTFGWHGFELSQDIVSGDPHGYPWKLGFGCGCLILLSRSHLRLILAWFAGLLLFVLEIALPDTQLKILALLILNEFCVGVTLIRFEEIDIIQQLVKEAREVQQEKERVHTKHEKMTLFWGRAQQQTDLWLHRTVPRLDLFSEVHAHVEDMSNQQALQDIMAVNGKLKELEDKLGPVEAWYVDGELTDKSKKRFEQAVTVLCQEQNMAGILGKFDLLICDVDNILSSATFFVPAVCADQHYGNMADRVGLESF